MYRKGLLFYTVILLFLASYVFSCSEDDDCNSEFGGSCDLLTNSCVCNATLGYVGSLCQDEIQYISVNERVVVTLQQNQTRYLSFTTNPSQFLRIYYTVHISYSLNYRS